MQTSITASPDVSDFLRASNKENALSELGLPKVTNPEIVAGTSTATRIFSPADIKSIVIEHVNVPNYVEYTHPNHAGDVISVGDGVTTITINSITNIKLADMPPFSIKGRDMDTAGDPKDLTRAEVRTMLNVEDGSTANSTDADLRDRSTHTGTQAISTIDGLSTVLDGSTSLSTLSGNWEDTYTTVQANSATNWNYQGTDIKDLSGNWEDTYTTVQANSASWLGDGSVTSVGVSGSDVFNITGSPIVSAGFIGLSLNIPTLSSTLGLPNKQDTLVSGTTIKTINNGSILGSGDIIVGNVSLSGTEILTNKTLIDPTITNYTEGVVNHGTVGGTLTISLSGGTFHTLTLSADLTVTMPTPTAGKSFTLKAITTGGHNATFLDVKWPNVTPPVITVDGSRYDIVSFVADGSLWSGSITQNYSV